MADTHETQTQDKPQVDEGVLIGLSMIGGAGIVSITVALGIGVVLPDVDSSIIGLIVMAGFGMLVMSIGGWAYATQPFKSFDDINVAHYHGHHHDDHDEHPVEGVTVDDLSDEVINQAGEVNTDEPRDEVESLKPIE